MYKFDTHVHTAEVSACAGLAAAEVARLYKKAGYGGICITDHYVREYFERHSGSWEQKVRAFTHGFDNARLEGERFGLTVVLGMELRLDGSANDYLAFGVTKEFLLANPRLYSLKLREVKELLSENRLLLFQAHPFRPWMTRADGSLLDGAEVFNGHPFHESRNHKALAFAQKNNLMMLAGSDCHETTGVGTSGILTETLPGTSAELAELIRSGKYSLITP